MLNKIVIHFSKTQTTSTSGVVLNHAWDIRVCSIHTGVLNSFSLIFCISDFSLPLTYYVPVWVGFVLSLVYVCVSVGLVPVQTVHNAKQTSHPLCSLKPVSLVAESTESQNDRKFKGLSAWESHHHIIWMWYFLNKLSWCQTPTFKLNFLI